VISPRLGATFKLNDAGTTLIKGSYGRYYRGIVTGEFDPATPSISDRFAFSGTYDAQGNPEDLDLVTSNRNLRIDSGYENPYTDQYILSFEHQLSDRVGFAVNGVWKKWDNQSAWRDIGGTYVPVTRTAEGQTFELLQLTSGAESRILQLSNQDPMEATYKGVHFQVNKRMSNRWQGTVGLTLSKAEGRLGTSTARVTPIDNGNSTAGTFGRPNMNDYTNDEGLLIWDRPVLFKSQLVYELGWNMTVAGNYMYQSGKPWGREVRFNGLTPEPTRVLYEPFNDDRRVDPLNGLDVRLEKALRFGGTAEGAVFGDFLNVFNNDAAESIVDRRAVSTNFGVPTRYVLPRRLMLGAKFRF
jgi:hypothetical protein